jgi:hypothetical protein
MKKVSSLALSLVFLCVLITIFGIMVLNYQNEEPDHPLGIKWSQKRKAYKTCQQFIEPKLKVPESVNWPAAFEINVSSQGKTSGEYDYTYIVSGFFDAHNSLGLTIRNYYRCDVSYLGGEWELIENWELVGLEISPLNINP